MKQFKPLIPETKTEWIIYWIDKWILQNFTCDHQYQIQSIVLKPPSELLGTREHYVETWKCENCGRLWHRSYETN